MTTACKISSTGTVTQVNPRSSADVVITVDDVKDAPRLAKLLSSVVKDIAALKRRYSPRRIDFEDVAVSTAAAQVSLKHNFSGRVRYYVVGWRSSTGAASLVEDTTNTDVTTLVLKSYVAGTATIRIEEAG